MYFVKFLSVGAIATAIQYVLMIILVEFMMDDVVLASAISFAVSSVFNYLMNYYFTFRSSADHKVASLKFGATALCGLVLNSLVVYLLYELLGLYYLLAQVAATGVVLIWNYFVHRFWTYKSA